MSVFVLQVYSVPQRRSFIGFFTAVSAKLYRRKFDSLSKVVRIFYKLLFQSQYIKLIKSDFW